MNNRGIVNIFLLVSAAALGVGGWIMYNSEKPLRALPYINSMQEGLRAQEDKTGKHTVADFRLTDQTGKTVTRADLAGSIVVADFFFTNCKSICPVMTNQLERVYAKYKGNPEVKLISHTVDPERDTVETLAVYAARHNADPAQWKFVTGDKPQLYALARKSYFVATSEGTGDQHDFVHSQLFSLVDKEGHIRGIYDGTDSAEVERMMVDMDVLLKAYKTKRK